MNTQPSSELVKDTLVGVLLGLAIQLAAVGFEHKTIIGLE